MEVIMKNNFENENLTLYFEGEINSYNAEDVEKEIDEILRNKNIKSVVINMENLSYISSAGLRIIVRLKQKYNDVSLVKVPSSVYDVLEMVGFENLMIIERIG